MATVSILRSPQCLDDMASRRAPLSTLPHAANSPLRPATSKRARADGPAHFDELNAPPLKRQLLDLDSRVQDRENVPPQPQTPKKKKAVSNLDILLAGQVQQPIGTARERVTRNVAAAAVAAAAGREKVKNVQAEPVRRDKQRTNDSRLDDISRWQRYYEKQFPKFVFYFENVPEEARRLCSRQVRELGAAEDRFFSRAVTHIITTRPTPSGNGVQHDEQQPSAAEELAQHNGTINPSLLDRRNKAIDELAGTNRTRYNFDAALNKKNAGLGQSPERASNRIASAKGDVLLKAKDLGIKIWQLEKLQRILKVMYADDEATEAPEHDPYRAGKTVKQSNLSQLIKNEARSQATTRELGPLQGELVPLNEPYIFVRCMNEKTKPLMARQYQKVSKPEEGEWPQFRPVTQGKCPFITEEPRRRSGERAEEPAKKVKTEQHEQRTTRSRAAADSQIKRPTKRTHDETFEAKQHDRLSPYEGPGQQQHQQQQQPQQSHQQRALMELAQEPLRRTQAQHDVEVNDSTQDTENATEQQYENESQAAEDATTDAPQITPTMVGESVAAKPKADFTSYANHSRQNSFDLMAPPAALPAPNPGISAPGGEPLASGLQKSGMTSAIRSQMGISSAAAGPGIKAGTSRDIHSLQRRILERKSTGSGSTLGMSGAASAAIAPATATSQQSNPGLMHSRGMLDIAGRARAENPRAAKTKAVEKLNAHSRVAEVLAIDDDHYELAQRKMEQHYKAKIKREPKPGYCENCREKFDDFDLHTQSRKHRRFAQAKENWADLDALLAKLQRPLKDKKRKRNDFE